MNLKRLSIIVTVLVGLRVIGAEVKKPSNIDTMITIELKTIKEMIKTSSSIENAMESIAVHIINSQIESQLTTPDMITNYAQLIAAKFNTSADKVIQNLDGVINEARIFSKYANQASDIILGSTSVYEAVTKILALIQSSPDNKLLTSDYFTEFLVKNLAYVFSVSSLIPILHMNTPNALKLIPKDLDIDRPLFIEALELFDGSLGADRVLQYIVDHYDWKKAITLRSKRIVTNDPLFSTMVPLTGNSATITSGKNSKGIYLALTFASNPFGNELYVTAMNSKGVEPSLFATATRLIDLSAQCTEIDPFNILFLTSGHSIIYGYAKCDNKKYFFVARLSESGRLLQFMRYEKTPPATPALQKNR